MKDGDGMSLMISKEFEVNYYEIDYKKRALITTLMNYFEDVSTKQSEDLNVGLDYLREKNLGWVIYKWNVEVERYPVYGEKIMVRTRPLSSRKFYAYRKFDIIDEQGYTIVTAESIWFLIDIEKRKAIRITNEMKDAYEIQETKIDPFNIKKIVKSENTDFEKSFNVRYSDIDTNRHVNNVNYALWAIETVPIDIITECTLKKINITYEKEAKYGNMIKAMTELINKNEKNIVYVHKIIDNQGNILSLLETQWEKD